MADPQQKPAFDPNEVYQTKPAFDATSAYPSAAPAAPRVVATPQSQGQIDRVMGPQSMAGQLGQQAKHLSNYVPDISTLGREASAAGSTVKSLFDPRTYYHMAADKADDYSSRTGVHEDQDTMTKIGPAGRVITRAVLEPVAAAASDYGLVPESLGGRGFGRSHVAPQITTENALDVAPEATGTAGGAVIGGRLMQSAGNAAKIAGVKAGALPEATPRIPISDDIAGGVPKAAVRGVGRALTNPVIAHAVTPLAAAAASSTLGPLADIGMTGGSVLLGEKLGIPEMVKGAGHRMSEVGLSPSEVLDQRTNRIVDSLMKERETLGDRIQTIKKGGGEAPDHMTERYDSLEDRIRDEAKSSPTLLKTLKDVEAAEASPKPAPDATGENKPYAGGVEETPKPKVSVPQQQNLPLQDERTISGPLFDKTAQPNIAEGWKTPEFQEIKSGVKRVGRAGESKAAQASFGDAENHSLGQFARVNGPRIDAAIPDTPEGQTLANHLHDIKGNELERVAKDLKVDISDVEKTGKKGNTVNRQEVFNRLLDAGHTPEDIVNTHLDRFGNPASVSGGSGAPDISSDLGKVRQRLADPNLRAENTIGNALMADQHATGPRLTDRISTMNDLAAKVKTASPEELQELDRQGQNLYRDTKTNIAKSYSEQPKAAAAKPNIAEASEAKVWRDQPGEAHPVRIKYEYGEPTEVDGRHRVIEALKNGYDRIEVTVDRGHGPQKTTVDVRELAKKMGVTPDSLAATDAQQTKIRAGGGKPRISVTKQQ